MKLSVSVPFRLFALAAGSAAACQAHGQTSAQPAPPQGAQAQAPAQPARPQTQGTPTPTPPQQARPQTPAADPIARTTFIASMDSEFRQMDADRNGSLIRAEIEQFQRAAALAQLQATNRALFTRLDADRNGQLSAAEFAGLPMQVPAPNAAPILSQTDINKDGSVTLVEYRTGKLANFDRLDADKDGIVSAAEMKAAGIIR